MTMRLAFVLVAAFAAAFLLPLTPAHGAGGGTSPHGGAIDGVWDSNIGAIYEITQHGHKFLWWADRLNETAMGEIQGSTMRATWSGTNGAGNGVAVIKEIDAGGRAHRIEWSNGVVFSR